MYHCHIQLYLIGRQQDLWRQIEAIPPLEHFSHTFTQSSRPEPGLLAQADAIFADLRGMDAGETLDLLTAGKKETAELVVLADGAQAETAAGFPVTDIWVAPMSETETRFRFQKWQRNRKLAVDLWETGQFLDAGIDSTPNMVWFKSKDGIHEKVNSSFCKTVNKSKEQVQGRRHGYIWDVEEEGSVCVESEFEVMNRRETCIFDETIQTGDGETQLETYKSPLYDLDGSVMGTVGIAVNVTQKRAYEKEIVEKSRTLEMLFSSMDSGVMCHSVDGKRVISVNRAALELLGYNSQEELLLDGFDAVAQSVLDEDKPKLRECMDSLKKPGDSASVEYRVRHSDGKVLHILGNAKLMEEDGELFYQRFLLDITDQKLNEEKKDQEIKYQEQLFDIFSTFLSDNVDDIYMMLNEDGTRAEFVSPNIERILGISAKAILEDPWQIGHAEYITGYEVGSEGLAALEPGMALEPMETRRFHLKTGEEKWFRETVYCVSVQGTRKIVVYISDRTRERKNELALTEALEMAQVANKAKSTFLSNVSHDIRTPMNAIMGFITLLREESGDPERVREYTQKISTASQHLLGLINDVLDMNKLESGSAVLNISEINLAVIVDEINAIIRPQARAKEQHFEVFTSALTNEHLMGDKLRISQILLNILSNAVKYTPEGGRIKMWVNQLPQVDKSYSRIRFTISDNGQGMSEEYQKVIFAPFTREQSSVLNKIQGTGLGMAITKNLVDLMNGSIEVTSKVGEGSIFVVELELRIQDKKDDPQFWEKHNIRRILIADDDPDICRDIVHKMEGTGVDTQFATDGARAIEMIGIARDEGRPYDLILLDWKMPDLDGLATARLILRNDPNHTHILLFTAYDWEDIEDEALQVGIRNFMTKPFFMSNFKEAIERMAEPAQKKKAAGDGSSVMKGKHALVVDDIDVNRMVLVKILTTLGAECDMAENGQEAVEKFNASQPGDYDIILMDIQMPIMNGHEATRTIRAGTHPEARTIPIVAMTANAFVEDVRAALDAGMDAHVAKPIVLKQLEQTLREVFERREAMKG